MIEESLRTAGRSYWRPKTKEYNEGSGTEMETPLRRKLECQKLIYSNVTPQASSYLSLINC